MKNGAQTTNKNDRPAVIEVRGVSKVYRTGQIGAGTLQHDLQSWWAKKRGKPDPNRKIGAGDPGARFYALSDIDLTVYEGETLGIIGRNGAGKSTLLKLLCQVTAPTTGTIDVYGRIASVLEVGTGFHGEMTGRENIYMNGAILGMTPAEIDARMAEIISFSEIDEAFIDTPVKRYSSGMYVKLGFSVAAHLLSEIMVMDEVLAVGDAAFQNKCLRKMREEAAEKGRTVLYVSHNMQTIRQLCDRCAVLEAGRLKYIGDVETAIGIYLQQKENLLALDFRKEPAETWLRDPAISLISAAFAERADNRFDAEEPVRFRLAWKNLRDVEDVSLRVELRAISGEPQGTYAAFSLYSGKAGEEAFADIELDTHGLAPAAYQMVYTFFTVDALGVNKDLECRYGLCFEVLRNAYPGRWDARNWGYHLLDGMKVRTGEE